MKMTRIYGILILLLLLLFGLSLLHGKCRHSLGAGLDVLTGSTAQRESWRFIILESRLPQALTALLAGGALSVSGRCCRRPFATPSPRPTSLA
jgi:iron complex transport system permease protein